MLRLEDGLCLALEIVRDNAVVKWQECINNWDNNYESDILYGAESAEVRNIFN